MVLAKPIGVADGGIAVSSAPVALTDVPATVLDALGLEGMPGDSGIASDIVPKPLFSILEAEQRLRKFYTFEWERFDAVYLAPLEEYLVEGDVWDDSAWRKGGTFMPQR